VCDRVWIGYGFTSDKMKKWRKFFELIGYRRSAKPITIDTAAMLSRQSNSKVTNSHVVLKY